MSYRMRRLRLPLVNLSLLAVLVLTSLAVLTPQDAKAAGVVWSTDFEDGTLNAWSQGGGGGMFNNGNTNVTVSREQAYSGSRSAKMTINTSSGQDTGARLHRWAEADRHRSAYYSARYYFPQRVDVRAGWWNIFQFKSRTSSRNDPFWILYVGNRSDGSMYVYLRDWINKRSYQQNVANLPVGKWVHLEVYYQVDSGRNGRVTVWQDGVQLFDIRNVQTGYSGGRNTWGVTNYSSRLSPNPTTIYVDDAVIATERQGPGNSPAPSPQDPNPQEPGPDPVQPAPSGLAWQNPTNGATISGQVQLRLSVPEGTHGIWTWRDDWVWLGSDYSAQDGWTVTVDTTQWGNGQHTLRAWAVNAQEQRLAEQVITVNVQNGSLRWQSPTNGASVQGRINLQVSVPPGTAGVWFWRDNWNWLGSDWNGSDGWSIPVDTRSWGRGQHRLIVWAVDRNEQRLAEQIITVNVR